MACHEPGQAAAHTVRLSHHGGNSADRKMCAVIPRHLGKGGPLRASRCIPPGLCRIQHRAGCAKRNVRRFITPGGRLRSPPWTPMRRGVPAPSIPASTREANRPPVGCRQGFRALNHDQRAGAAPGRGTTLLAHGGDLLPSSYVRCRLAYRRSLRESPPLRGPSVLGLDLRSLARCAAGVRDEGMFFCLRRDRTKEWP